MKLNSYMYIAILLLKQNLFSFNLYVFVSQQINQSRLDQRMR